MPTAVIDGITTRYEVVGYWDVTVAVQTGESAAPRLLEFLDKETAGAR